jgi:hypothetical protein
MITTRRTAAHGRNHDGGVRGNDHDKAFTVTPAGGKAVP